VKKTTLTVPAESSYVEAFAAEARVSGRAVAELRVAEPGTTTAAPERPDGAPPELPWCPLSFASARAAIVEAETSLGGSLDELVVFADPPADLAAIADLTPKAIERAALEWAAGYAELIREAARRFVEKGRGAIVLVVAQSERGPLGAMAAGALLGLAEGILASGAGSFRFLAIKDESGQPDAVARQVLKTLDDTGRDPGKVQRFGGRPGFFGR